MLSAVACTIIAANIKWDLEDAFPGYAIDQVIVQPDGEWTVVADDSRPLPDFYHLYPSMDKAQARRQIILDMLAIIQQNLPGAVLRDVMQRAHDSKGLRQIEMERVT